MKCPSDGETLLMSERQGVEIDYCPRCRGVWLDRGELDKLLSAVDRDEDERAGYRDRDDRGRDDDRYRGRDDDRYVGHRGYSGHKRKKSFLSEMFEFGD
ncbi:MAG: zf-TFIIB domain-containing protein [Actinobacteria bacterium]|nr:zf-TFIIB domain-containing protein [Actinomycetota bacterium]